MFLKGKGSCPSVVAMRSMVEAERASRFALEFGKCVFRPAKLCRRFTDTMTVQATFFRDYRAKQSTRGLEADDLRRKRQHSETRAGLLFHTRHRRCRGDADALTSSFPVLSWISSCLKSKAL
jgi:hypothetical protein